MSGSRRGRPLSRYTPQFSHDILKTVLKADGIVYSFLGRELGGRPANSGLFCDGVADYELMAGSEDFPRGLDRVIEGAVKYRVTSMCSEQDPLDCHRCLLVGRALKERGCSVWHILPDGSLTAQEEAEESLLEMARMGEEDLFASRSERLGIAYRLRGRKVTYAEPPLDADTKEAAE